MASDNKSAAEQFADELGAAARQLQDAFLKLLELYREHQEKLQKANAEQQAALKKQFAKSLQAEGFAPTDENIAILKDHAEKTEAAQKQINELQTKLDGMDKEMSPEMDALLQKQDGLMKTRDLLAKGGPDGGPNPDEIKDLDNKLESVGKEIAELDPERHSVKTQLNAAQDKLGKLNQGEGLDGLKPDTTQNALRTFRENSTGAKLMQTNSLSKSEQIRMGVIKPDTGIGGGGAPSIKSTHGING